MGRDNANHRAAKGTPEKKKVETEIWKCFCRISLLRLFLSFWLFLLTSPFQFFDTCKQVGGGDRSEAWDRETMFSQLAKRSSKNVDSGVRHN